MNINIDIDKNGSRYVLRVNPESILSNKRLWFSLKRLNCDVIDSYYIAISFDEATKISKLQQIQEILEKFDYNCILSSEVKGNVASYNRELENFKLFSEKARSIRNNEFSDNPDLVEDFDRFQEVLKKTLVRDLYTLQLLSAYHMAFAQNSCNFAVPGAGKTAIVYGAYAYLKSLPEDDPKHVDKLLVIGPLSSFGPWEKEYKKCFGISPNVQRLSGDSTLSTAQKEQHLFSGNPAEITLLFTGGVYNLKNEIIDFLKRNKTMVVIDEAHRIKNPDGIWGKSSVDISKEAVSRIILTGTPVPNGYEDLYNLYQFLYPYKFKEILKFHYENLIDMSKNESFDSERVKSFTDNIAPYFIRIKKKDLDLPPVQNHIVHTAMSPLQRQIYDFIETNYVKDFELNSSGTVKNVLNKAKLIRLRQAAINPALLLKPIAETLSADDYESMAIKSVKLPDEFQQDSEIISKIIDFKNNEIPKKFLEVENIFKTHIAAENGKIIVWTIFVQNAKELQSYLEKKDIKSRLLIGEVDPFEREKIIDKFNNPNNLEFQVVIANPFSVAESISLHEGCHNAIYVERDYNCSNFLQSKDRIHRKGLAPNQETNYYYILSTDSIDDVIDDRLRLKAERMENIIDQDIPLFNRINDSDETDLIQALIENYVKRS